LKYKNKLNVYKIKKSDRCYTFLKYETKITKANKEIKIVSNLFVIKKSKNKNRRKLISSF